MIRHFSSRAGALLLALVLVVTGSGPIHRAAAHKPALRPLTLWLDWYPNADHAGIYVALAKGYYRSAGLNVAVRVPSGASDALQLVAHGSGDIAISYETEVLLARASGIPVVATASIVQRPLNCVMALKSSGITRPRQLEGKTVGVAGAASDYADVKAIVQQDGGDPRRVKTVALNYDLLTALYRKRVDAVEGVYWTWEALQAQQSGHPVNVMRLDHYGIPRYDELVFATGSHQLQSEPSALRAFQRATFQGYAYAVAHPAEATDILLHVKGVLSSSRTLIAHSLALLGPLFHADGRYGALSATQWQSYADWMARKGVLSKHVDAHAAVTTTLLP